MAGAAATSTIRTVRPIGPEAKQLAVDRGSTGSTGHLNSGDHVCAFCFGRAERAALIRRFIEDGLKCGQRCVCLVPPDEGFDLRRLPRNSTGAGEAGEIVVPVTPLRHLAIGGHTEVLKRTPHVATRVVTDLGWLESDSSESADLAGYERDINAYLSASGGVAVCLWDLEHDALATIADLFATHPRLLLGTSRVASPWFGSSPDATSVGGAGAKIRALLAIGALMGVTTDIDMIGQLVSTALRRLAGLRLEGIFIANQGWYGTSDTMQHPQRLGALAASMSQLGSSGGPLPGAGGLWWAFPLRGPGGRFGQLVVSAVDDSVDVDHFLVSLIAQKAGVAVANARLHQRHKTLSLQLRQTRTALADATELLDWNTAVRERLKHIVTAGGGAVDIASTIYDMTGHTVTVEDPDGTLRVSAGPDDPGPARSAAEHAQLLTRTMRAHHPIWHNGRLVAVAHRNDQVLGLLSLIGPIDDVGEGEALAVEDGATLLAMELARVHDLAQAESRLGRNLLVELLHGNVDETILEQARALGYNLARAHRAVLVECGEARDPDALFHAVRRAARDTGFGSWLALLGPRVVLVTSAGPPWEPLRSAILRESGAGSCRLGVGQTYGDLSELAASLRQAKLALKVHRIVGPAGQAIEFEKLGIYRLLADIADTADLEHYIATWLRPLDALLDYDAVNRSELVATLSRYLECRGHLQPTAEALNVHRNTLKYRMKRIQEIAGCDLTDPDTLFNLQLSTRAWQTLAGLRP